jgi:hypothetical protein
MRVQADTPAAEPPVAFENAISQQEVDVVTMDEPIDLVGSERAGSTISDTASDSSDDWPMDPNVLAAKFGASYGEKVRCSTFFI